MQDYPFGQLDQQRVPGMLLDVSSQGGCNGIKIVFDCVLMHSSGKLDVVM